MPDLLPLSRAARLANVSRGELQTRIRDGDLSTFEGSINLHDLMKVYPNINLDQDSMLEKVRYVKDTARPKRRLEESLPSAEILVSRLKTVGYDLFHARSDLGQLEELFAQVRERLSAIAAEAEASTASRIAELMDWMDTTQQELTRNALDTARLQTRNALMRIMAAHVKILPSGHEFFVEGQDSLLAASIRAGLYVNYGCASGNCGTCKARVVSGEVRRIRNHDYMLSESERNMGYVLTCSNTAVTDVILEADEAAQADDIPQQEIRTNLRKIEELEPDLVILHLQTPRTQTLRFMAGQDIDLRLDDSASIRLPIASCPCDNRNLQVILRRDDTSPFAQRIFNQRMRGESVVVSGPHGTFVLDHEHPNPLVFIALDDGFATVRSLCEHAVSSDEAESIQLIRVHSEPTPPYLEGLCRAWNDALDNFRYDLIDSGWSIDRVLAQIRQRQEDPSSVLVYAAGPLSDEEQLRAQLESLGIAPGNIFTRQA